jgi:hypothetical protein
MEQPALNDEDSINIMVRTSMRAVLRELDKNRIGEGLANLGGVWSAAVNLHDMALDAQLRSLGGPPLDTSGEFLMNVADQIAQIISVILRDDTSIDWHAHCIADQCHMQFTLLADETGVRGHDRTIIQSQLMPHFLQKLRKALESQLEKTFPYTVPKDRLRKFTDSVQHYLRGKGWKTEGEIALMMGETAVATSSSRARGRRP